MTNRRSLVLFLPTLAAGGAERALINLAPAFAAAGYDVTFLLQRREGKLLDIVPKGISVHSLNCSRTLFCLFPLVRFLRNEKPDILLSSMGHNNIISLWARALARVPVRVIACQQNALSMESERENWQFRILPLLYRLFLGRADGIIAASHGVADDLAITAQIPHERITVIHNPVITPDFDELAAEVIEHPWLAKEAPPVILGVGRMVPQKDFATLIAAFAIVARQKDARLMIIGEGPQYLELAALANRLGVGDYVAFLGFQKNPLPYMRAAAVFALSSRFEGFGNVVAEALACGTSVVSTDCPYGPSEILAGGEFGALVPVGNASAMAEAIIAALERPAAAAVLRQRGHDFNVTRAADSYMKLFGTTPGRKIIGFVKFSKFSGTNQSLEEQLHSHFPDAEIKTIDVRRFFDLRSFAFLKCLPFFAAEMFLKFIRDEIRPASRHAFASLVLKSPVFFKAMGEYAVRQMEPYRGDMLFTIQTQSLWNSAISGVPHFVYTDSAAQSHLYFRDFTVEKLPSAAFLALEGKLYVDAARIFTMSEHVSRSLIEFYGCDESKIAKILVGPNLKYVPAAPAPADLENKTILFVGKRWEEKGGPELLEAFKRLPERHRDARLVIVGATPQVNLPGYEVAGVVAPEDIPRFYRRAVIFCMPTRIEPFGIAFIEAMVHSLVVIAPDHGAMPDYIQDKVNGMLHEPGDIESITKALTYLLDNPVERRAIAERGFFAVRDTYSWDAVGESLRKEITGYLADDVDDNEEYAPHKLRRSP